MTATLLTIVSFLSVSSTFVNTNSGLLKVPASTRNNALSGISKRAVSPLSVTSDNGYNYVLNSTCIFTLNAVV
jgi:hypothetical protein